MSRTVLFQADFAYATHNEGELSFEEGDTIRILNSDGDWWFGELIRTNEQGWLSPAYGHTVEDQTPYVSDSDQDKINKRGNLLKDIIRAEQSYCHDLDIFIKVIVTPLFQRNTNFKRNFLNEPSIAVSLTILRDIFVSSTKFLLEIGKADSADKIATSHVMLAPSLQLYSSYASENASCLNAVKSFGRQLREFTNENPLPPGLSFESCLVLPLEHYSKYSSNLQEYLWLTPQNRPEFSSLQLALDSINNQTVKIDDTLNELDASIKLLTLQSQFVGHPKIFIQSRRLVKAGEMERVRITGGNVAVKAYYVHLFNDSVICSQHNVVMNTFKLTKTIDLMGASVTQVSIPGMANTFSVTGAGTAEVFRCSPEEFPNWIEEIESVISELRSKRSDNRGFNIAQSTNALPSTKNLENRALSVHRFLSSELRLADQVTIMVNVVIKPLMAASTGGILSIGDDSNKMKDDNISAATRVQANAITEALQTNDIKSFLRAAESLAIALKDLVTNIRSECDSVQWSENVLIGGIFNSEQVKTLLGIYKVYANGQQGCLRVLKGSMFTAFYREAENALSNYPGTLADKLENPRNRPAQYLDFLNQLLQVTPSTHGDYQQLISAIKGVSIVSADVEGTVKNKRNYEKLIEIQSSLVVTTNLLYAVDGKFVQKLASADRKFLKEGDLKKVCRKKNKTFRFWLFNDFLIYGSALGNSTYSFHRALDLKSCSPTLLTNPKNAFQINAAEKSFIVIAPYENAQQDWVNKILDARALLGVHEDASLSLAPVWETDNSGGGCCVCKQPFGIFRRRHHCRKCGNLVCGDHSKKTEIIPYIHKSDRQRVCDNCYGRDIVVDRQQQQTIITTAHSYSKPVNSNISITNQTALGRSGTQAQSALNFQQNTTQQSGTVNPAVSPPKAVTVTTQAATSTSALRGGNNNNEFKEIPKVRHPPSTQNNSNDQRAPPPPPKTRAEQPLAPPVPAQERISAEVNHVNEPEPPAPTVDPFVADNRYATYIRMRKMLPDGPVRQKMVSDGILSEVEIDGFFRGVYVAPVNRPPPPLLSGAPRPAPPPPPTLKSTAAVDLSQKPEAPVNGMLAQLQQVNLKQTAQRKARPPSVAAKNAPGMLSMLATAMNNRRDFLKEASDDENESDGGFSDDDFDD